MGATQRLKQQFPSLIFVGPGTATCRISAARRQAALREGWVDLVGLGRMVLTYPELLWDASEGRRLSGNAFAERLAIVRPLHVKDCLRMLSAGQFLQRF